MCQIFKNKRRNCQSKLIKLYFDVRLNLDSYNIKEGEIASNQFLIFSSTMLNLMILRDGWDLSQNGESRGQKGQKSGDL